MPQAFTNEMVLTEDVARSLGLQIGDQIERSLNEAYYAGIPAPLTLVGILVGGETGPKTKLGFVSYEYLESNASFVGSGPSLLVVAKEGRKAASDDFLESSIASSLTEIETYEGDVAYWVDMGRRGFYVIFGIVNILVAGIVALVIGIINRIALTRRFPELGLLHAIGYHKKRLVRRLTLETGFVTGLAWGIGLALALLILSGLKATFYYARGMDLDLTNLAPLWFTLPLPLVVVTFSAFSARRLFARLDSIAIIERGSLGAENQDQKQKVKRSSAKPLSSLIFYLRHRRRGALLVVSMTLVILGVAFPGFLVSMSMYTMMSDIEYLRYVSEISPVNSNMVDSAVVSQIRAHPTVAGVMQTKSLGIQVHIPPGSESQVRLYGLLEDDLPALMSLLDVRLIEGRLPAPRANEIVVSRMIATNRDLKIGDRVGRPIQVASEQDGPMAEDDIPAEMVIVGLLDSDDLWIGFTSLEYLQNHELTASRATRLLAVPQAGRKVEMDKWLVENVASTQTDVRVYDLRRQEYLQIMQILLVLFAGIESIIALVAAVAVAALNHIFFAQRIPEFGVLHAIGHSRLWLVVRTIKETASAVGVAWLIGALVCVFGMLAVDALIYTPIGLSLNMLNLTPWLFTLPVPLAVILVGAGTISRTLSRLDPIAIVEMKS
jgi:hypothetical protein